MTKDNTTSGSIPLDYSDEFSADDFRTRTWSLGRLQRQEELTRRLHPTLLHALTAAAKLDEDVHVTVLPEKESGEPAQLTYKELYADARRLAQGLIDRGIEPGDRVLIVLPTCMDFLTTFFAVQIAGAVPVPAYPPSGFRIETGIERLGHIARHSGARICVTWQTLRHLLGELAHQAKTLERVVTVTELRGASTLAKVKRPDADTPAFIQYTSGSTGQPKGVLLTHRNLVANIHAMGQALQINHEDVLVGWCPLYHDMGLIGTFLSAIYWRLPLVLLSPMAFLTKPRRWLRAMSDYGGTVSPAPNFGYALAVKRVKPEDREGLDLSRWRVALNGAEPVTRGAVSEFQNTYAPYGLAPSAMFPVYGLAESSLAVSFPDPGSQVRFVTVEREALAQGNAKLVSAEASGTTTLVCLGKSIPGHALQVVNDQGEPVAERVVGNVITAGDSVMRGYFHDTDATETTIKGGWLWTGDLGFVHERELYVCGRSKDVIIVRGKNYHAEDIEQCAETVEGVRKGGIVAFGVFDEQAGHDGVVLVCETRLESDEERRALVQRISEVVIEGTGLPVDEVVLVEPSTIPKTSSGKRQRRQCRESYLQAKLKPQRSDRWRTGLVFVRSLTGEMRMRTRRLVRRDE